MFPYKPPQQLRALFIIHYAPLLLIILLGPLTAMYNVFHLPTNQLFTILLGIIIFFIGSYIYLKWEIFWEKNFKGQLVTHGPFNQIRNPHYTSLLIIGFGLALFFYSQLSLFVAVIAIPIMIASIIDEEKHLEKQYGEKFNEYKKKVPWRLLPKIF